MIILVINDSTNQEKTEMGMNKTKNVQKKNKIPDDIPIIWVNIV